VTVKDARGGAFVFRAEDIGRDHNGRNALITVYHNKTMMAYDHIRFEKHAERTTLSNAAHGMLGDKEVAAGFISKSDLKHHLDLFCHGLWNAMIDAEPAENMAGDATLPVDFVAKPHVLENSGTILYGEQGQGKSYTALLMAVAIDAGLNGFWETTQQRVLYVNLERSAKSIKRRIGCVNTALGQDPSRKLLTLNRRGRSLEELEPLLERTIAEQEVGHVIIDSISRTGIGDLNENKPANKAMDILNHLGASWLALGHMGRSNKTRLFGSVMFDAGADIMLRLLSAKNPKGELGVKLEVTKANDIAWAPPMFLAYTFDDFGLHGARRAREGEFAELKALAVASLADELEQWLTQEVGEGTATDAANALGRNRTNVSHTLSNDPRFTSRRDGTSVIYAVEFKEGESNSSSR
jgi:hypothetical protein